jgi:hypothetical protein
MSGTITLGGKTLASHSNDTDKTTLASNVVFPTYPSGSFFEANFYEAQSSDAVSEIWYKVPTECTLIAFQISAYHSASHTAIAHVYTGTSAGSDTTQQWYKDAANTSGWVTWITSDGNSTYSPLMSNPVNLGGVGEHNFVGVRTTSSQSHGYWTKVTTTLRFRID